MEIGESLVYSWLKHVKKCSIVETNWKASELWNKKSFKSKDLLIKEIKTILDNHNVEIDVNALFGRNFKQTEVDVIGLNFDNEKMCYAFESAFHEKGLRYSKKEFKTVIIEKLLKASFVLVEYLGVKKAEIVFASPKLTTKNRENDLVELQNVFQQISDKFRMISEYDFKFVVYFEDEYKEMLILQLLAVVDKINNNTESFVRAVKLLKIFEKVENISEKNKKNANTNIKPIEKESIGMYAKKSIIKILSSKSDDILNDEIVKNLCDKKFSKETFRLSTYSVLVSEDEISNVDRGRYYSVPFDYKGRKYYICSQWTDRQQERLVEWVRKTNTSIQC